MADKSVETPPADGITRIPIKQLTKMMLEGENKEVLKYLRTLPKPECAEVKEQLINNLEALRLQQQKQQKDGAGGTGTTGKKSSRRPPPKERPPGASGSGKTTSEGKKTSEKLPSSTSKQSGLTSGQDTMSKLKFNIIVSENSSDSSKERAPVGSYLWKKDLGRGMFGVVYKAVHKDTNKSVAIKEIDTELIPTDKLSGVLKEAQLMAKLDHPNIVQIYEVLQAKIKIYFVLEYINRGSLQKLVKSVGLLPEAVAAPIVRQTLEGLHFLHSQSPPIIHRDIKCANLLIDKLGIIKLADFGTAKEDVGKNVTVIGTPYWMAPEIIEVSGAQPISDIWSLGCTVIEMLTGDPPYFNLSTMQALFLIVEDAHPPIPEGLSDSLTHFLSKCCFVKVPTKRPTAGALLTQHGWITKDGSKDKDKNYDKLVEAIQGPAVAEPPPIADLSKLTGDGSGKKQSLRVKSSGPKGSVLPGDTTKPRSGSRGRFKTPEELETIIKLVMEERDQLLIENNELKAQLEHLQRQAGRD